MDQVFPASLPRHGPGSRESTLRALSAIPKEMYSTADILDLGCGTGPSTLVLASKTSGRVVAVDAHQPYITRLDERLKEEESTLSARSVRTICARFEDCDPSLPFLTDPRQAQDVPTQFDIIWSEGSAYHAGGLLRVLPMWRRYLKPGGFIAVSELFLERDAPHELRQMFAGEAAEFLPVAEMVARLQTEANKSCWELVDHFVLDPKRDWWDSYYNPLLSNITQLRERAKNGCSRVSQEATALMDEVENTEIKLFQNYPDKWGYAFFIVRRVD